MARKTDKPERMVARRIVLALDSSPLGVSALEIAALVAADLKAELQGMFVEDINLVHLAGLPFSHEIAYGSAGARRLDPLGVERTLHAQGQRVRAALEAAATRMRLTWSFQVVRGQLVAEVMAATHLHDADVLIVGAARTMVRPAPVPGRPAHPAVAIVFDDTPGAERALRTAASIARQSHLELLILLPPDGKEREARVLRMLPDLAGRTRIEPLESAAPHAVARAVQRLRAKLLVLRADPSQPKGGPLAEVLREAECPVVLVR